MCSSKKWAKVHRNFFRGCYSTKPPTMQNFVAFIKKMPEISAIENLCSQKKWAKVHQNFLGGCYPLRPPIMPNFIEIGQTRMEIGVGRKKNFHTQTDRLRHTRHTDCLSRTPQHARGLTKNARLASKKYEEFDRRPPVGGRPGARAPAPPKSGPEYDQSFYRARLC